MSLVGYECDCAEHCTCFDHVGADLTPLESADADRWWRMQRIADVVAEQATLAPMGVWSGG